MKKLREGLDVGENACGLQREQRMGEHPSRPPVYKCKNGRASFKTPNTSAERGRGVHGGTGNWEGGILERVSTVLKGREWTAQAKADPTLYSINCSNTFKLLAFQATKKHFTKE